MVERLFSKCRHILTYDQHRMLPKFFEAIVFLKENSDFWSLQLVQEMLTGKWDERLGLEYDSEDDDFADDKYQGYLWWPWPYYLYNTVIDTGKDKYTNTEYGNKRHGHDVFMVLQKDTVRTCVSVYPCLHSVMSIVHLLFQNLPVENASCGNDLVTTSSASWCHPWL